MTWAHLPHLPAWMKPRPTEVLDPFGLNAALELRRAARPARQEAARKGAQKRRGM